MNWKKIFVVTMIIGFAASLWIGWQRYQIEDYARAYEITMPYQEVVKMASFSGESIDQQLASWRAVGVNSITLNELTIHDLVNAGYFNLHAHYEGNDLVLEGSTEGLQLIAERLSKRLSSARDIALRDQNTLVVSGTVNDFFNSNTLSKYDFYSERTHVTERVASIVEYVGLGFLDDEIERINRSGLALRFRPAYVYGLQNATYSIDQLLQYVDRYSQQPYICFNGNDVLGTDVQLDYFAEQLKARNMSVAMIETPIQRQFIEQTGLKALIEKVDYRAVRAFTTFDFIRDRYDYQIPYHHRGEEVANTYFRAISERNIDIIFFKTYTQSGKMIAVPAEHYASNLAMLKQRLARHGISNITADWNRSEQNFYRQALYVNRHLVAIVALAVAAACLLLFNLFYALPAKINLLLSALATGGVAGIYLLNIKVAQFNLVFGLVSAIVFALLAIYYVVWQARRLYDRPTALSASAVFMRGVVVLVSAVVISLIGAAFQISFYADSEFLLEIGLFRGVKVSQLVPLLAALGIAVYYFGNEILNQKNLTRWQQIKYVLALNVQIWQVLVGFSLLLLVALLLLRSGHDSNLGTASLELTFRNFLEYFLYARPRSKALILGFPIIILFMRVVNRKRYAWSYPIFAFLCGIGQVDVLNTFSHIRTPLQLSIIRVLLAVVLAIGVYFIYALALAILGRLISWFKRAIRLEASL